MFNAYVAPKTTPPTECGATEFAEVQLLLPDIAPIPCHVWLCTHSFADCHLEVFGKLYFLGTVKREDYLPVSIAIKSYVLQLLSSYEMLVALEPLDMFLVLYSDSSQKYYVARPEKGTDCLILSEAYIATNIKNNLNRAQR